MESPPAGQYEENRFKALLHWLHWSELEVTAWFLFKIYMNSAFFYLPVYGDIFYEVCGLCVRHDDAFRRHRQSYFPKLLSTGSGLWV